MLSMVLVEGYGLVWEEDGVVLADGPTDMDLGGDGVVISGVVLVLVLGARITKLVFPVQKKSKLPA